MPVVSLLVAGLQQTLSVCYHLTADTVSMLSSYSGHCQNVTIALGESPTYLYVDEIFLRWVWFHLVLFSCFVLHQIIIIFLSHEKMRRYTLGSVFHGMLLHSLLNQSFKIKKNYVCVYMCRACTCPDIFGEVGRQLLVSTMWVLGVELKSLGLAVSAFVSWTISLACNQSFWLGFKIVSKYSSL